WRMGRTAVAIQCGAGLRRHEILDQRFRIERLARGERRTGGLAASALDAGIEGDKPVPGEIRNRGDAEVRCREVCKLQISGRQCQEALGPWVDDKIQSAGEHML